MTSISQAMHGPEASVGMLLAARHNPVLELAVRVLFPALIFGTVLVQQPSEILSVVGQAVLWFALLAAAIIVLVLQRASRVFLFCLASIAAIRVARLALGTSPALDVAYDLATGLLYAVAGAAIFLHRSDVLHRQMIAFVALSIPIMALQMLGERWTQILRTDASYSDYQFASLLFQKTESVGYNVLQLRPAGLLNANVFLSVVMLPIMAVNFSRWRSRYLRWTDVAVVAVVVLAMSKILLLAMTLFAIWYFVAGPKETRLRMLKLVSVVTLMILLYSYAFPSAFAVNLSPAFVYRNFAIRFADVIAVLAGLPVTEVLIEDVEGTMLLESYAAGEQSAVSLLARHWQVVLMLLLVIGFMLMRALRSLRRNRPDLAHLARNGLFAALLSLLITSFIGSPFFAFWAGGFVILPFIARGVWRSHKRTPAMPRAAQSST